MQEVYPVAHSRREADDRIPVGHDHPKDEEGLGIRSSRRRSLVLGPLPEHFESFERCIIVIWGETRAKTEQACKQGQDAHSPHMFGASVEDAAHIRDLHFVSCSEDLMRIEVRRRVIESCAEIEIRLLWWRKRQCNVCVDVHAWVRGVVVAKDVYIGADRATRDQYAPALHNWSGDFRRTLDHFSIQESGIVVVPSIVQTPTMSSSNVSRCLAVKLASAIAWIAVTPDYTMSAPVAPFTSRVLCR